MVKLKISYKRNDTDCLFVLPMEIKIDLGDNVVAALMKAHKIAFQKLSSENGSAFGDIISIESLDYGYTT